MVKERSSEESKNWELKVNEKNLRVYIHRIGSFRDTKSVYVKADFMFPAHMAMGKVMTAVSSIFLIAIDFPQGTSSDMG